MRIAIVIGTRPEAIKMAPVYLVLKNTPGVQVLLLSTGQHRAMLDQALSVFGIKPDIDLSLMQPNQSLGSIAARIIEGVQTALEELKPNVVLVHGDTSTCLCAAIAANYSGIPVGHVEAGLRTYDFKSPWPEEMNRRLTDPISRWCFAPTQKAKQNLLEEKISSENIYLTGNTVIDSLLRAREMVRSAQPEIAGIKPESYAGKRVVLVTGHRRESFGAPFENICLAIRDIVRAYEDVVVIYPVHLNPNVQKPVKMILGNEDRIYLIEPVGYLPFVFLMDRCAFIITDSGGVQEEAPSFGKLVLVTRDTTERPEAIDAGFARIVGTERNNIFSAACEILDDSERDSIANCANPFGDGRASERIVQILLNSESKPSLEV